MCQNAKNAYMRRRINTSCIKSQVVELWGLRVVRRNSQNDLDTLMTRHLVSKGGKTGEGGISIDSSLLAQLDGGRLASMICLRLDLSLLLETINNVLIAPANLMRQALDGAVLATRLQPQDPQGLRDDHLLLAVEWRGDTFIELQALHSGSPTGCLMRQHSTNSFQKDS